MRTDSLSSKVLSALNAKKGEYVSGQELADSLNVTRAAIWKTIKKLREDGVEIVGAPNKGYSLSPDADVLDAESIRAKLDSESKAFYREIVCKKETGSTNTDLKGQSSSFQGEGLVLVAERQTAGRGRFGRSFFSPQGAGVYFSVLLRPKFDAADVGVLTSAAAVAGARACEIINPRLEQGQVKIKWVNDLYLNDKKICGILTEGAASSLETGKLDYCVLGVGFNLYVDPARTPDELKKTVGGIFAKRPKAGTRAALVAAFLNELYSLHSQASSRDVLNEYRARQALVGQRIAVASPMFESKNVRYATAVGVDDAFRLLVSYEDDPDSIVPLNSGEVRASKAP